MSVVSDFTGKVEAVCELPFVVFKTDYHIYMSNMISWHPLEIPVSNQMVSIRQTTI